MSSSFLGQIFTSLWKFLSSVMSELSELLVIASFFSASCYLCNSIHNSDYAFFYILISLIQYNAFPHLFLSITPSFFFSINVTLYRGCVRPSTVGEEVVIYLNVSLVQFSGSGRVFNLLKKKS